MGLGTLPSSPAEGMLCVVMVNTVISINILKDLLRSILQVVGINYPPDSDPCTSSACISSTEIYVEEFRNRNPAVRFYTTTTTTVCRRRRRSSRDNCSVCLTRFKPVSEVNQLECDHVFHKECLEKWMEYWNTTCPLCRTPIMLNVDDEQVTETMYCF